MPGVSDLLELAASGDDTSLSSAEREFAGDLEAREFFGRLCASLQNLAEWNRHSSLSEYARFSSDGAELAIDAALNVGDRVRISMTGTGKFDWVTVTSIDASEDEFILTVRPSPDVTDHDDKRDTTSHFFHAMATNNFCATLRSNTVSMFVIGLNEGSNTADTRSVIESARNAAVANVGYYFGMQKAEWTRFCRGFLGLDDE